MVIFQPPAEELAGHVIERSGGVPGLVRIAGILTEIGRSRSHRGAIDRRQQHQIAAGIVDFPSAQREAKQILVKPEAVVGHDAQETLFRAARGISEAAYPATALAAGIECQREGSLIKYCRGLIEISHLDAVVCVPARTLTDA